MIMTQEHIFLMGNKQFPYVKQGKISNKFFIEEICIGIG
jgi:hypothetical protein